MLARILIASAGLISVSTPAFAQENERFFLRGGPAFATFDATGSVTVAGQPVPGADVSVKNNTGFAIEGGYFLTRDISVSLTIGIPPTARIQGDGTLGPAGQLGSVRYGPSVLAAQYNVPVKGPLRPYIGGGFSYTLVFHERGSAIRDLKVSDGNGPAIQAGIEYRISRNFALFFDAKKIWVAVDATGISDTPQGPLLARSRVALDPVILNTGLSWHF
jgi:outer membrane protein